MTKTDFTKYLVLSGYRLYSRERICDIYTHVLNLHVRCTVCDKYCVFNTDTTGTWTDMTKPLYYVDYIVVEDEQGYKVIHK